jgi:hypothetical protein
MFARIVIVNLAALALGGCIAPTGGDGGDGPPPGPEWMVGIWETTYENGVSPGLIELRGDGTFSLNAKRSGVGGATARRSNSATRASPSFAVPGATT